MAFSAAAAAADTKGRGSGGHRHRYHGPTGQPEGPREAVTDKGYHSDETLQALAEAEVRTYISGDETTFSSGY